MFGANLGHHKLLQGLEDHSAVTANANVTFPPLLSLIFKRDTTFFSRHFYVLVGVRALHVFF
jgi:hypothetical protein